MTSTSAARRNFPTLRLLAAPFRWLFGSRRRVMTAGAVLFAILAAPVMWWSNQLMGLPDIGDPFDVRAFRSFTIADDRNAFVLYRQAMDRLRPLDEVVAASGSKVEGVLPMASGMVATKRSGGSPEEKLDLLAAWSKADPILRRWAEANREAMALYLQGSGHPDAFDPVGDSPRELRQWRALRSLHLLALLEASRLQNLGDMAGAWDWYRAAMRASYHRGRYGSPRDRIRALHWRREILDRLAAWSTDPRTTRGMVRQALDDVLACSALAPSDAYTIKAEYPYKLGMLDSPRNPGRDETLPRLYRLFGAPEYELSPAPLQAIVDAWRWWRREPERSRRVIRLAVANWLAYFQVPPDRRPRPDPNVPGPLRFYAFGPEAPAGARALLPESLDRWLESTVDATLILKEWNPTVILAKEASGYRAPVVLLASELYRRDHGTVPLWDEALVGPYLKELPDDGLGDGARPTGSAAVETPGGRDSNERGK